MVRPFSSELPEDSISGGVGGVDRVVEWVDGARIVVGRGEVFVGHGTTAYGETEDEETASGEDKLHLVTEIVPWSVWMPITVPSGMVMAHAPTRQVRQNAMSFMVSGGLVKEACLRWSMRMTKIPNRCDANETSSHVRQAKELDRSPSAGETEHIP